MDGLVLHQLRTAALAKYICEHVEKELDMESIVAACLFHDMGNIIKSRLDVFPEFLEPQGIEYWQAVKDEFISKYGESAHNASVAIAREIGLSEKAVTIIDNISFSKLRETAEGDSLEQKIAEYSDSRVGPYGVVALEERFADAAKRYVGRYSSIEESRKRYEEHLEYVKDIERQITEISSISPDAVTEETIQPTLEELKHFQVK